MGAALLFASPVIALVYWNRRKPLDDYFDVAGWLVNRKDGIHTD